ncbi:hypothetical protein [Saccharicrinis sp. FJH54]|uniref:hypothetical protein n=1 Tax=Saccharicrinis sp. FJH54 TaxID=3344665 RepID=UPI0035D4FE55
MTKEERKKLRLVFIVLMVVMLLAVPIVYYGYFEQIQNDIVLGNIDKHNERIEKLRTLIKYKWNNYDAKKLLVQEYCRNDEFENALRFLNEIGFKDYIVFSTMRGMIYELDGKQDSADFYYRYALDLFERKNKAKAGFNLYRLNLLMLLHQKKEAIKEWECYRQSENYNTAFDSRKTIDEFDRKGFINSELGIPQEYFIDVNTNN